MNSSQQTVYYTVPLATLIGGLSQRSSACHTTKRDIFYTKMHQHWATQD
jgi:hypothetical protein